MQMILYGIPPPNIRIQEKKGLQKDMNTLATWCRNNQLTINTLKTKVMVFGDKKDREKFADIQVTFEGEAIETVTSYNYLGIKLDQNLNNELHGKAIIQRVSDKLVHLRRIRKFINSKCFAGVSQSRKKKEITNVTKQGT